MNQKHLMFAAVAVVLGLAVLLSLLLRSSDGKVDTVEIEVPVPSISTAAIEQPVEIPVVEEVDAPLVVETIEDLVVEEDVDEGNEVEELVEEDVGPVLPSLNDSDDFLYSQLSSLNTKNQLLQLLTSGQMVRKFVMLVDNISRGEVPSRDMPILGPRSELISTELGEINYLMEESSYQRFDELVTTVVAVENNQASSMYLLLSPLFEQAYGELGYPGRTFEQTLLEAIDRVIEARLPEGPFELTQPSVHYEFADPRIESLSAIEKLLIRMGPSNTEKLQAKLSELKALLNGS